MLSRPARADFGGLVIWHRVTVMKKWPQLICGSQSTLPKLAVSTQGPMSHPPCVPREGRRGTATGYRCWLIYYQEEKSPSQAKRPWLSPSWLGLGLQAGASPEFTDSPERTWCSASYMAAGHLNRGHCGDDVIGVCVAHIQFFSKSLLLDKALAPPESLRRDGHCDLGSHVP